MAGALELLPHFLRQLAADLARDLGRTFRPPRRDIGFDLPVARALRLSSLQ